MATLNARKSLREGSSNELSVSLRDIQPAASTNLSNLPYSVRTLPFPLFSALICNVDVQQMQRRGAEGIAIRIDTTKESKHDGEEVRC